jgi:hypothetical protein
MAVCAVDGFLFFGAFWLGRASGACMHAVRMGG